MFLARVVLVGSVAAAGVMGTYFFVWKSDPVPMSKALNRKTNYQTKYGSGKVGHQYSYFLVAPFEAGNEKWWKWSHRRWQDDIVDGENGPKSDEFKETKVEGAFDPSEADAVSQGTASTKRALNKICDEIYKKAKNDVEIDGSEEKKVNLMRDLWRYCSVLGRRPKTIKEVKQPVEDSTIGKSSEAKLISTTSAENVKFWEEKEKWFSTLNISGNGYFKWKVGFGEGRKSLKDVCEFAYKGNGNTTNSGIWIKPTKDEADKYCSLDTAPTNTTG